MTTPRPIDARDAKISLQRDRIEALELIVREARVLLEQGLRGDAMRSLKRAFPNETHHSPIGPSNGAAA